MGGVIKQKAKKTVRRTTKRRVIKRPYKKKPLKQRRIALERIKRLFELGDWIIQEYKNKDIDFGEKLANRYVELARKISMKYKVRMPSELKRRFCKKCHSFLVPGINLKVRIDTKQKSVVYECLECGFKMRYPYVKEKKKERKEERKKKERKSKKRE